MLLARKSYQLRRPNFLENYININLSLDWVVPEIIHTSPHGITPYPLGISIPEGFVKTPHPPTPHYSATLLKKN